MTKISTLKHGKVVQWSTPLEGTKVLIILSPSVRGACSGRWCSSMALIVRVSGLSSFWGAIAQTCS